MLATPPGGRRGPGATVHGVYDFWLQGGQSSRADRDLARAIERRFPSVPGHVRAAHAFHLRAAVWAARRGVSRFIRAGHMSALPGGRNVHEAVRAVRPDAEVIYASRDPDAHEWARAMLAWGGRATAIAIGDAGSVLDHEPVRAMLAAGEPVCVISGLTAHFAPADVAAARVARLAAALPPGSYLAVSAAIPDGSPESAELAGMLAPARVHRHTPAGIAGWLEGAGLVIEPPGVTDVRAVPGRAGWATRHLEARPPGIIAGGVARVP